MMKNLQKMGGIAALYSGIALLVAMVGFLLVVGTLGVTDPVQKVVQLVDNQAVLYFLMLISYVLWGIVFVVLVLALNERLKNNSPAMMQIATAIGLIWACLCIASGQVYNLGMGVVVDLYGADPAQAATVWMAIESVVNGLGSAGGEILGGTWVLLVSWAALKAGEFSKALNYVGVLTGVTALISAVPGLSLVAALFGLGKIVWSLWLGIVMLRSKTSAVA
jgi:phosphoglycerol transferase MdoB-like AlkP superfamily enzyme